MSDFEGVEAVATVQIDGRVKWFDPGKGYGFIVPNDPTLTDMKDVLLHISSLRDAGRVVVAEGAPIRCCPLSPSDASDHSSGVNIRCTLVRTKTYKQECDQ